MKIDLPSFNKVRVLVVGDVMLDRYWHGSTTRISPEAPVPVVNVNGLEERPGGAANVALNLSMLGCQTGLLAMVGNDEPATSLENLLHASQIQCYFQRLDNAPTITKLRVIGRNQQLIRLDFEKKLSHPNPQQFIAQYEELLAQYDLVVFSDYAKGTLQHVQQMIKLARAKNIPVLIDPKNKDFSIYSGATIITPNLKEFEEVVGHCSGEAEIFAKGLALLQEHQLQALLVTRGEDGMTLLQSGQEPMNLPTHAREVYDVTGAGDTVISVLAAALSAGESFEESARLANTAAGIVVGKLGAAGVTLPELRRALQRQYNSEVGILTEEQLLIAVADARAHNETVVMTNGCFDILHAGHVAYLEEAKSLGKRLIVAVNDDASVARLKGSSRPINTLQHRMAVLAALRVVDWVVPFTEDTPERLIKCVAPDLLVKGGDYQVHEIAGSDFVLANGGAVKILPLVDGCSTTNVVNKIAKQKNEEITV